MEVDALICPACGRESPREAAFCARCGAPLEAVRTHQLEERKVVTVLFADLVGSTAKAESHDPEEARRILTGPDDGLLDFVDHLVEWACGVPLLVVATARPELLERRALRRRPRRPRTLRAIGSVRPRSWPRWAT